MSEEKKSGPAKKGPSKSVFESTIQQTDDFRRAVEQLQNSAAHSSTTYKGLENFLKASSPKVEEFSKSLENLRESLVRARVQNEVRDLETQLRERVEQLQKDLANNKKKAEDVDGLRQTIKSLKKKREIQHLLDSVTTEAHEEIESNSEFQQRFSFCTNFQAPVMTFGP